MSFDDLGTVMTAPLFLGKSLADIYEEIEIIESESAVQTSGQAERRRRGIKKFASMFTEEVRIALQEHLQIKLSDDYDYSDDEIEELFDRITADFPYSYDDEGEPLEMGRVFEDIIDTFYKNNLPM